MLGTVVRAIGKFLRKWFWSKPTEKTTTKRVVVKATEVAHAYVCIQYRGQWINLRENEVEIFNAMARNDKRAMAQKFAALEKKGQVKFVEIDGKTVCVKTDRDDKRWKRKDRR